MVIDRLKEIKNLTTQEEAVVQYILNHPRDLLHMSISDLALASYTSTSTIVRLCKKAGTRGFSDFKYSYVSDYSKLLQLNENLDSIPFTPQTNIDEIMDRLPIIYAKTIDYTKSILDRSTILRCVAYIQASQHIGIYGTGANFNIALAYQHKFEEIGIHVIAYDSAHWQHLSRLKTQKIPSFAILLSVTGENPLILDTAKRLKSLDIPTLSISGYTNRKLNDICTENVRIVTGLNELEYHNLSTSMSAQYVLDILFAALYVKHYDDILLVTKHARQTQKSFKDNE